MSRHQSLRGGRLRCTENLLNDLRTGRPTWDREWLAQVAARLDPGQRQSISGGAIA